MKKSDPQESARSWPRAQGSPSGLSRQARAERFDWCPVRLSIVLFALGMLLLGRFRLATYPIL
jgi:hypothetical protein